MNASPLLLPPNPVPIGARCTPHLGCSSCGKVLAVVHVWQELPGLYCSAACVQQARLVLTA